MNEGIAPTPHHTTNRKWRPLDVLNPNGSLSLLHIHYADALQRTPSAIYWPLFCSWIALPIAAIALMSLSSHYNFLGQSQSGFVILGLTMFGGFFALKAASRYILAPHIAAAELVAARAHVSQDFSDSIDAPTTRISDEQALNHFRIFRYEAEHHRLFGDGLIPFAQLPPTTTHAWRPLDVFWLWGVPMPGEHTYNALQRVESHFYWKCVWLALSIWLVSASVIVTFILPGSKGTSAYTVMMFLPLVLVLAIRAQQPHITKKLLAYARGGNFLVK